MSDPNKVHQMRARALGRNLLSHICRLTRRANVRPAIRITISTVEAGEILGHVDLDFAPAQTVHDTLMSLGDMWDSEYGSADQLSGVVDGPSDPMHAHVFFLTKPHLAAEIDSAFTGLDLTELTSAVLDDADPCDRMTVTRALDAMFGDCATEDEEEDGDER